MAIASVLAGAALLATDVFLYGRFEKSAGDNVWGYRGPIVERKQAGGTVVDLGNPEESFDGMHLTVRGNEIVAGALAPTIMELTSRLERP